MSARDAIEKRIEALAPKADADDLVKLADAASKVIHGPQGGAYASHGKTEYAGGYRTETANVLDGEKNGTGFTA